LDADEYAAATGRSDAYADEHVVADRNVDEHSDEYAAAARRANAYTNEHAATRRYANKHTAPAGRSDANTHEYTPARRNDGDSDLGSRSDTGDIAYPDGHRASDAARADRNAAPGERRRRL